MAINILLIFEVHVLPLLQNTVFKYYKIQSQNILTTDHLNVAVLSHFTFASFPF